MFWISLVSAFGLALLFTEKREEFPVSFFHNIFLKVLRIFRYEKLEKVAKGLGLAPIGSANVGGASDGNIAASTGVKVLDGLGAVGVGAHAPNESIKISLVEPRIKLISALINELL